MEQRRRTASKFFPVYQPLLDCDFRTGFLPPEITFTRASTATFVGSNGLIQTAPIDVPRINYNPTLGSTARFLCESVAKTNLILRSADITNAAWTKTRSSTPGTAVAAPDGSITGYKLIEDASVNNSHDIRQTAPNGAVTTYTQSVFVKKDTREWIYLELQNFAGQSNRARAWFNVNTGTLGAGVTIGTGVTYVSHKIENYGNGWYRCSMVSIVDAAVASTQYFLSLSTGDNISNYTGDGVSGLYLWGLELVDSEFLTSYIPTVAAPVTRAADIATITGSNFAKWFNPWAGTMLVEGVPVGGTSSTFPYLAALVGANPVNDSIGVSWTAATGQLRGVVTAGGANIADMATTPAVTAGTAVTAALSYHPNGSKFASAGQLATQVANTNLPLCTSLTLGGSVRGQPAACMEYELLQYWQQDADPKMLQYLTGPGYV